MKEEKLIKNVDLIIQSEESKYLVCLKYSKNKSELVVTLKLHNYFIKDFLSLLDDNIKPIIVDTNLAIDIFRQCEIDTILDINLYKSTLDILKSLDENHECLYDYDFMKYINSNDILIVINQNSLNPHKPFLSLINKIQNTQQELSKKIGILLPTIKIKTDDDMQINEYRLKFRNEEYAKKPYSSYDNIIVDLENFIYREIHNIISIEDVQKLLKTLIMEYPYMSKYILNNVNLAYVYNVFALLCKDKIFLHKHKVIMEAIFEFNETHTEEEIVEIIKQRI